MRTLMLRAAIETGAAVTVRDERIVRRILGADPIAAWVAEGARI